VQFLVLSRAGADQVAVFELVHGATGSNRPIHHRFQQVSVALVTKKSQFISHGVDAVLRSIRSNRNENVAGKLAVEELGSDVFDPPRQKLSSVGSFKLHRTPALLVDA
jgi:hypothetical protein